MYVVDQCIAPLFPVHGFATFHDGTCCIRDRSTEVRLTQGVRDLSGCQWSPTVGGPSATLARGASALHLIERNC